MPFVEDRREARTYNGRKITAFLGVHTCLTQHDGAKKKKKKKKKRARFAFPTRAAGRPAYFTLYLIKLICNYIHAWI